MHSHLGTTALPYILDLISHQPAVRKSNVLALVIQTAASTARKEGLLGRLFPFRRPLQS